MDARWERVRREFKQLAKEEVEDDVLLRAWES